MELDFPVIDAPAATAPAAPSLPTQPSKRATLALVDLKDAALARFGDWRAQAAALVEKYRSVVIDPSTPKGYKELTAAIAEVRAPRFAAQNVDKNFATEVTRIRSAVGAEKDEVIAYLADTERHLVAQKTAHDLKVEQEREAAVRAEALRTATHRDNLATLRGYVAAAAGKTSAQIEAGIAALAGVEITEAWEEFFGEADAAKTETLASLRALHEKTAAAERDAAERLRIAEEQRIEAARLQAQADAMAEQLAAMAAAQKALADEKAAFEAERAAALAGAAAEEAAALAAEQQQLAELHATFTADLEVPRTEPTPAYEQALAAPVLEPLAIAEATLVAEPAAEAPAAPVPAVAAPSLAAEPEALLLLRDALAFTEYAATAFAGKFPNQPKPSVEWWAGLRVQLDLLRPLLTAAIYEATGSHA